MRVRPLLAFFFLPIIACVGSSSHGGTTISASNYDQTCSAASDCIDVGEGDVCSCFAAIGCGDTAINQRERDRFEGDVSALRGNCSGSPSACPAICIYSETTCVGGRCGVCHNRGCSTQADAGLSD